MKSPLPFDMEHFFYLLLKGRITSESTGNLQIARIKIPKHYPKLLHPVHDNEKLPILNLFDFTGLIYLYVVQMNF